MKFCQRKLRKPPLTTSQNNVQPRSSGLLPVPLICWLQRAGFNVPNRSVIVPSFFWKTKWHTPFCISLIASSISRAFEVAIVTLPVIFAIAVIRLTVIGLFVVTTILLVFRITLFNLIQRYRKYFPRIFWNKSKNGSRKEKRKNNNRICVKWRFRENIKFNEIGRFD